MIVLPLNPVLNLFGSTITALDVTEGRDAIGVATKTQSADRSIFGIIQPAGDNLVALLPEGAQSDGVMVLHTASAVSVATNRQNGTVTAQTFVRHGGNLWKLHAIQNWTPHQKIARYLMTRYVATDGFPV